MWRALTLVASAALLAALVPAVRHLREAPPSPPAAIRTTFTASPGVDLGAGDDVLDAAISDDSRQIAYVASRDGGVQLWHRANDSIRADPLPGTEGASLPAWKRGGRALAFFADGALKQLSIGDASVRTLAPAPTPGGASWSSDGSLLFAPDLRGPIKVMRRGAVSDATRLSDGDRGHAFPVATASGFTYEATRSDGARVIRLVRDGRESELTNAAGHAQLIEDVLLYVRDGALLAQRFESETRRLVGRAVPLASAVGTSASGHGYFAAGSRLLLTAPAAAGAHELSWFDASGMRLSAIAEPGDYWQVRLAPDDSRVAVTALDPLLHTLDVFIVPVAAPRAATRLSLSLGADTDPTFSPDGGRVAFHSAQGRASQLLVRPAVGSSPEAPLRGAPPGAAPSDWQGQRLLLQVPSMATGLDLWLLDVTGGGASPITRGGFNEWDATWSPDSRQIAYVSDESGQPEIYVDSWPTGGRRMRVSFGGGRRPQWAPKAGTLFFMRGTRVMRTSGLVGGDNSGTPEPVFEADGLIDYAVAHRSPRFAAITRARAQRTDAEAITDWQTLVAARPR